MKKRSNIAKLIRVLILTSGLLAISISSFNYLIQDRIEEDLSKIEQAEADGDSERDHEFIYLPYYLASITTLQIDLHHFLDILFDIPLVVEDKCHYENIPEFTTSSFFKILFHNIIAPNAP